MMKQALFLVCVLFWSVAAAAQSRFPVLSPIIAMGRSGRIQPSIAYQVSPDAYMRGAYYPAPSPAPSYQRSGMYAPQQQQQQQPAVQNKIVLKFDPHMLGLSEAQKQQLIPTLNRTKTGQVRRVTLVGYSSIPNNSYHRLTALSRFLTDNNRYLRVNVYEVQPQNVLPQNDHSVEVIEY